MNKYTFLAIVMAMGILTPLFAAWAKITHQRFADQALTASFIGAGLAIVSLVWYACIRLQKRETRS